MKKLVTGAVAAALLIAAPFDSRAQTTAADNTAAAFVTTVLTSYILVPVTVIGGTIYGIITTMRQNQPPPPQRVTRAFQMYLERNANGLTQDVTSGRGPVIADLATVLEIPASHLARFGQVLRADRKELLTLADPAQLTPDRAMTFMRKVGDLVKTDGVLSADFRAFEARHAND